jgi:hypothetical protein
MVYTIVKVLVTATLIVAISEVSRRSTLLGSILASLPLVSLLAILWMFVEKQGTERIAAFSVGVFWLVLPSLLFFLILPLLLRADWNFWASLGVASAATVLAYFGMLTVLPRLGITL